MKKRDFQMELWMKEKKQELALMTDEKERIRYFKKTVLPELSQLEEKEKRVWQDHRADFDSSLLDRKVGNEDDTGVKIPQEIVAACRRGDFEDIIFSKKPDDLYQLVTDDALSHILKGRTNQQKQVLFYMDVYGYFGADLEAVMKTSKRNITAIHTRALEHIRGQILPIILLRFKLEHDDKCREFARYKGIATTDHERQFAALMGEQYKDYYGEPTFDLQSVMIRVKSDKKKGKQNLNKPLEKRE